MHKMKKQRTATRYVCTYSRTPFSHLLEPININFRSPRKGRRMMKMKMTKSKEKMKRRRKKKKRKRKSLEMRGFQSMFRQHKSLYHI